MNQNLNPEFLHNKYKKFVYNQSKFTTPSGEFVNIFNAIKSVDHDLSKISFEVDPAWNSIDFSNPSTVDYFDLVKQRARHIRKNYEYVRFWLSGGLDSYTALWGFIESGSHIDEIVIQQQYLHSPSELSNYEENITARNIISHHKESLKGTKISWYNHDWRHFDRVYDLDFDWPAWCFGGPALEFHAGVTLFNPFFEHPELLDLMDQGVRVADVTGHEKPVVRQVNDEWYHVMLDAKFYPIIGRPGSVPFYFDHEFPDLYVSEAHRTKNKQPTRVPHPFYDPIAHKYIRKYYEPKKLTMSEKSVIMEVECNLYPDTSHLVEKFYKNMERIATSYPTLIPDNWVVTTGPSGIFGLASSLERNFNCKYHEL
jgi:hypothetical protein